MARCFKTAAALVLLCAVATQASRLALEDDFSDADFIGRGLLQRTLDCTKVHPACKTCRNQRKPGTRTSELVCSTCQSGWRLRRDGLSKTCDCAPGLYKNETGSCVPCAEGQYCLGGDATNTDSAASDCPTGLATVFAGAKSQAQCFTTQGYGRVATRGANGKVELSGSLCGVGLYNVGGNTAGCQRCGAGLTTSGQGSSSTSQCLAPAGSYLDKGIGKLCQKGTYSTALNSNPTCTACPAGITTEGEGSTASTDCDRAIKGYYLVNATYAEPCPLNTYSDTESSSGSCTTCPHDWRTKATGADGESLCLAPPGYELNDPSDPTAMITECQNGWYKADWNRNTCIKCGDELVTEGTGSVSKDACLVKVGYGMISLSPMAAAMCSNNTYGDDVTRPASAAARCTACPPDMYTLDTLTGTNTTGYTDETDCKVKPGYGTTATLVEKCKVGFWNDGNNREPCKPCAAGYTTLADGSTSEDACVIQAGWYLGSDDLAAPCDKGSYSVGGDATVREPTSCSPCPTGYSTQTDESTSADDCHVCAAGYGGAGCTQCTYNTYSYGGQKDGQNCTECATGSVSRKQSTEAAMCYSAFIDAVRDVFSTTGTWASSGATANSATCQAACGDATDCITYRYKADSDAATPAPTCELYNEDAAGTKSLYFKVNNGVDFVEYTIPNADDFGVLVDTVAAVDAAGCRKACISSGDCEVAQVAQDGTCTLRRSELDSEYTGMFAVRGNKLISDP